MSRGRIAYFDFLRVFAMFGVVFMHSAAVALRNGMGRSWIFFHLPTSLFFTSVPLFFMISGALLLSNPQTKDAIPFLKHHLPKLLVPLAVWSVLTLLPRFLTAETLKSGIDWIGLIQAVLSMTKGCVVTPLWFMYVLIPIYLLAPFLKLMIDGISRDGKRYMIGLIIVISIYKTVCVFLPPKIMNLFGIDLFDSLFLFSGYIGFFLLGYFLHMTQHHFSNRGLLIIAVADYVLIVLYTWRQSEQAGVYMQTIQAQNLFFMGLLAVCIFLLCKQNYKRLKWKRGESIIRGLSGLSYGIYLLHGLVLTMLPLYGIEMCFWQDALMGLGITTVVCLISIFVLSSIKPLCFVCTGLSYKTACQSCNLKALIHVRNADSNEHRIKLE